MKIKTASISFLIVIALLLGPSATVPAATRGSIYVGPMASGEAVRILSTGYVLQPLTNACPDCLGIVVGPADLSNHSIINRLQAAYEAGHAAALTNATTASIRQLHDLLAHRGSAEPVPGGAQVDLVAFRKAQRSDGQFHFSSHILLPRVAGAALSFNKVTKRASKSLRRKLRKKLAKLEKRRQRQALALADQRDIEALSKIFSATPIVPELPPQVGDPQQNLINLAESYQTHAIGVDPTYGNQVQVVNTMWAARSFLNSVDFYYVLQEADYSDEPFGMLFAWNNNTGNIPYLPNAIVLQPSPQTTMEATTVTSSVSQTVGASVGWDGLNGLDASVSGSVTISNSKTTTIPPISIFLDTNLVTGRTGWTYNVNDVNNQAPESITVFNQWIWEIPFSAYRSSQTVFQFGTGANMFTCYDTGNQTQELDVRVGFTSNVPIPFGHTFVLQPPLVTGVSPSSVEVGNPFTIQGTGMYPSLVQSVLIGGTPVNPANITTVSDTQIKVIAPNTGVDCLLGCTVAVVTTQGTSNTNFTITID